MLILQAYAAWGDGCVDHLAGDYSFALWDNAKRHLFAARDTIGNCGLYYARVNDTIILSDNLNAVRVHSSIGNDLNDTAMAEFLLFGQRDTQTAFRNITTVAKGNFVTVDTTSREVKIQSYWALDFDPPMLRYRSEDDYIEHFFHLFRLCVKDRLRSKRVVVSLSGGLDSTSVATIANEIVRANETASELVLLNNTYTRVVENNEHVFAQEVAQKLDMPLNVFYADDYPMTESVFMKAEPSQVFTSGLVQATGRRARELGDVIMGGNGADELLLETPIFEILQGLPVARAAELYLWEWRFLGYRPILHIGYYLNRLKQENWFRKGKSEGYIFKTPFEYPGWINPELERRLDLKNRWDDFWTKPPQTPHRLHPFGHHAFTQIDWKARIEPLRPLDFVPPENISPFLDKRLAEFMYALPPLPWTRNKYLLRRAMRDKLPESVLKRPKTSPGPVLTRLLDTPNMEWVDTWKPEPELERFVRREAIPSIRETDDLALSTIGLRPLLLNLWLKSLKNDT